MIGYNDGRSVNPEPEFSSLPPKPTVAPNRTSVTFATLRQLSLVIKKIASDRGDWLR